MAYKDGGKRALDLILAIPCTVLFSWVVVLIVVAYGLTLNWPLLFSQTRVGKGGRTFKMWKFRTLSRDENMPLSLRSFRLGRWMRFTNLDELPQLWNIWRGEMSFVGPRPLPKEYLPLYSQEQKIRHEVRPGVTGWAQVNGRTSISWKKKFELDNYYVAHVSLSLDAIILVKTFRLMLSFRKDVSLEEEKFKGN